MSLSSTTKTWSLAPSSTTIDLKLYSFLLFQTQREIDELCIPEKLTRKEKFLKILLEG